MKSDPFKDAALAFGTIMALISVWSFVEGKRAANKSDNQIKNLHEKIDLILAKVKK